ncbi:hypothetical protein BDV26DRAFT_257414 [Aspergillus bertholletiae]|uniref:Transferase family-domain-containing protein n=1 Tax=Aspergillus bertholletiae TaxID=1226010 RepID=A0A5N7BFC5_9EURO|nr:hypothetical protein BDV26DRAFT_257414 [Aspergillus bertholletiae]
MTSCIHIQPSKPQASNCGFPLSFLDTYFMPIDIVLVLQGPLDQHRFSESLAEAVSIYYPVCGRFQRPSLDTQGELRLHLNRSVPIFWLPGHKSEFQRTNWKAFVKSVSTNRIIKGHDTPLLQVAVTPLPNTSQTAIGVSFCHLLGDATSFYSFLQAWSDIYSTGSTSKTSPVLERIRFPTGAVATPTPVDQIPRRIPRRSQRFAPNLTSKIQAYTPLAYTIIFKTLEYARFRIPAHSLAALVSKAQARVSPATCSTQDAFKAYLLKALNRFVYNGLTTFPRVTRIVTIVDGRKVRNVSAAYFGNCITAVDTPYLFASQSLAEVAVAVREGIVSLSPEVLAAGDQWIQKIQSANGLMNLTPAFDADTLYVNDWTKIAVESVDFGLQQDFFCQPLEVESLPVRNWCMIYRASEKKGSEVAKFAYEVQVAVPRGKAAALVQGVALDVEEAFAEYFW